MHWIESPSPRQLARIAGGLYLVNIVGGFFAIGVVPAATANSIQANELLYRMGLAVHTVVVLTNVPVAVIFYDLFKVVNRRVALLVAFFTLVGTAIESATMLSQFAPLVLLEGGHSTSAAIDLSAYGYNLSVVFFGFYCLSIGYLVYRSTFMPRVIGVLLAFAGAAYLFNSYAFFLAPGFAAHLFPFIQLPSLLGEGSLTVWLLAMGVNRERWTTLEKVA